MSINVYIIPFLIIALLLYSLFKKVRVYDSFVKGAKSGLELVFEILPFIIAIMLAVELLRVSGLTEILVHLLAPVFNFFGIPTEVIELVLLRPFTGSGSYALLDDIFTKYGADSYISRCAATIIGSCETVFYVAAIYFSKTSVKKLGPSIPISIIAAVVASIFSCLFCRIM